MPKGDDEILLGTPIAASDERRSKDDDDDGDGEPTLKPRDTADPRGDLNPGGLEPEVGDPRLATPEGMAVDTGLTGLTDLQGNALPTGADHDGIGGDDILGGRLGANSPVDAQRNPLGTSGGDTGGKPGGPPGQGGSGSAMPGMRNRDLYGNEDDLDHHDKPDETPPPPPHEPDSPEPPAPPIVDDDGYPIPPPPPDLPPLPDSPDLGPDDMTDPDAGGGGEVSGGGRLSPGTIDGGDIDFVEGYGGGPRVEGGTPPPPPGDPVGDPDDGTSGVDSTTGSGPTRAPGSDVSRPVNPRDGLGGTPPPGGGNGPGGGPGGDDIGLTGVSSAATAAVGAPGAPDLTTVGSGGGPGIQSTIASGGDDGPGEGDDDPPPDDTDLVSGIRDDSIRPLDDVLGTTARSAPAQRAGTPDVGPADTGTAAVDHFATSFLADAAPVAPDLVAAGLASDLGADPRPAVEEPASVVQLDPGGADLLEGSLPDDDGLDA